MQSRFFCFCLVLFSAPTLSAGDKVDKLIDIGPKGWEFTGEIKSDDPKLKIDLMDKTFLMPAKRFDVKLEKNHRYRFVLDTEDPKLDPFLVVKSTSGEVLIFDDDGGGKLNSKLTFSPFNGTGLYTIYAASLHGQAGPISLKVAPIATYQVDPTVHELKKDGLKLKGELADNRQEFHYKVRLQAGKKYRIDLSSAKFDSFLELRDEAGKLIAEDDDTGGKLAARISKNISKDGVYWVIASSTNLSQTGTFALEIRAE